MAVEAYAANSHISKLYNSIHGGLRVAYNLFSGSTGFLEEIFLPKFFHTSYFMFYLLVLNSPSHTHPPRPIHL